MPVIHETYGYWDMSFFVVSLYLAWENSDSWLDNFGPGLIESTYFPIEHGNIAAIAMLVYERAPMSS